MATPETKEKQIHVQVRFSSSTLLEELKTLANQDHRSLNGEIILALEEFVGRRKEDKR